MSASHLETLSREDAAREREQLMETLGMSVEDAERIVDRNVLSTEQYVALRRIQDLEWLLELR